MVTIPHTAKPRRTPEAWANLPRRKCADCGKSYKPKRPLRSIDKYGFCSPTCKKSFHKHGGAYRKLREELYKLIAREMLDLQERFKEIVTAALKQMAAETLDRLAPDPEAPQ